MEYRELLGASPTAPGSASAAGRPAAPDGIVIVALDRERAALRLRPLPNVVRARLTLITAREPAVASLPSVGTVVEVDVQPAWRPRQHALAATRRPGLAGRIARLATDPVGTIERRLGRGPDSRSALTPAVKALRDLLADLPGTGILAVDGHDHLVVARGAPSTGQVAGGSLRRLADLEAGKHS